MTQEEIEALMNDPVSDEIAKLIPDENIDDILSQIDDLNYEDEKKTKVETKVEQDIPDLDDIAKDETVKNISLDDNLLESSDIVEDTSSIENVSEEESEDKNKKIDDSRYPLPLSNEHKIVNQLNEVAEDSEAKASQIFDVLSYILDENEKITTKLNENEEFVNSQTELLVKLTSKFPKIDILQEQLNEANKIKDTFEDTRNLINEENNKIFEAMELMQFHDINRQKIERVMSVIRKLTSYLNGIFEDDSGKPDVQIAKHISGDSQSTVDDDDLDSLIAEFNK